MKRQHKRGGYSRKPAAASAPQAPAVKEGSAMDRLQQAKEHTDFLDSHKKTYVPKPRAIRRYEKFASMGEEK